jgi:predicted ATPase
MLSYIKINNFKTYVEEIVVGPLRSLTVVLGRNGSGKITELLLHSEVTAVIGYNKRSCHNDLVEVQNEPVRWLIWISKWCGRFIARLNSHA